MIKKRKGIPPITGNPIRLIDKKNMCIGEWNQKEKKEEGGTTTRRKGGQAMAATKQWNRRSGGRGEAPINPGDLVKRESTWKEITSEKHLLVYKKIYDEKLYAFVYCVYELESGKVYESLLINGGGLTHIKI